MSDKMGARLFDVNTPKSLIWWLVIASVLQYPMIHELVLKSRTPSRCHILGPEQLFAAAGSLSRLD
jgi:hypothetical protein